MITAVLGLLMGVVQSAPAHGCNSQLVEVLMIHAIRTSVGSDTTSGWLGALADSRSGQAIQIFHSDIARPWTVADIAAEAGMSRASFSSAFTRGVGHAPYAYMRNWRMTRARAALFERNSNVGNVAASVGYTSQSAFGHAFRRTFGESPRQHTA